MYGRIYCNVKLKYCKNKVLVLYCIPECTLMVLCSVSTVHWNLAVVVFLALEINYWWRRQLSEGEVVLAVCETMQGIFWGLLFMKIEFVASLKKRDKTVNTCKYLFWVQPSLYNVFNAVITLRSSAATGRTALLNAGIILFGVETSIVMGGTDSTISWKPSEQ